MQRPRPPGLEIPERSGNPNGSRPPGTSSQRCATTASTVGPRDKFGSVGVGATDSPVDYYRDLPRGAFRACSSAETIARNSGSPSYRIPLMKNVGVPLTPLRMPLR